MGPPGPLMGMGGGRGAPRGGGPMRGRGGPMMGGASSFSRVGKITTLFIFFCGGYFPPN